MRGIAALVLAAAAASGCSRLENVGKEPAFTPPGEAADPAPPVTARRVALATPPPPRSPEPYTSGSLWRSGPTSLFGDRRAKALGDILTVVIEIDDEAEIRNATQRQRSGSEEMSIGAFFGAPAVVEDVFNIDLGPAASIDSTSSSAGDGSVRRNEEITLRVAATVVDVLPNGHLVVAATRRSG